MHHHPWWHVVFFTAEPHFLANPAVDVARAVCILLATVAVIRVTHVVVRTPQMPMHQTYRYTGLLLLLAFVIYTEIQVMGTALTWRLFLAFAAVLAALAGIDRKDKL